MIRNKTIYILLLVIISLLLSCKDETELQGEGVVNLSFSKASTKGISNDILPEECELRIYNTNDRLIQKYTSLSEIPEAIYLAAANYKATVKIGKGVNISKDSSAISYYGEKDFTIVAGTAISLNIECRIINSVVAVNFDQTVLDRFELENIAWLSLAGNISKDSALIDTTTTITFTENGRGYVILPEGATDIFWGFYGKSAKTDPTSTTPTKTAEISGKISSPNKATLYTLDFKYSPTPDGYFDMMVTISDSIDIYDDHFDFQLQPTIKGKDFDMASSGLIFDGNTVSFDINSSIKLTNISIKTEDMNTATLDILQNGNLNTITGITYSATDDANGVLSLDLDYFKKYISAGVKDIRITATNEQNGSVYEDMEINVSGMMSEAILDLWANTAEFKAQVLIDNPTSVEIEFNNNGTWERFSTTHIGNNIYSADITSNTWTETTNDAGIKVYQPNGGIFAQNNYERRLIVDGEIYATNNFITPNGDNIPDGDMESGSLPCWGTNAGGSLSWGSGNNTFASELCKQGTKTGMGGSKCAYLKAGEALGALTSGNIFTGQFEFGGIIAQNGTVKFGQAHVWNTRPRKLRFKYASKIGSVNINKFNMTDLPLQIGDQDKARVYFAIVNWDSRHNVTAGPNDNPPTGPWDPAAQISTDEGEIIGYASMYIDIDQDPMTTVEIPIYYYDKITKPNKNITMIVSAATSAYGDFMLGCSTNELWLDDFELLY